MNTLYKKSSTGKLLRWDIAVEGATIVTRHGQVDGQIQETRDTVKGGKSAGKVNATSAEEQARLEAEAKHRKQIARKGYVESADRAMKGETDAEGGIVPMLAHKFSEQGHKIVYPAYAQPKFDGSRCIADEDGSLWSRTRKLITGVPHISAEKVSMMLDGELYNHAYHDRFEDLMSFIRSATPKPGHEVVEYHVYDIPHETATFEERLVMLEVLREKNLPSIVVTETIKVANEDELMEAFDRFIAQGYEGAMVRNAKGLYVNKRSYDLQKVKEFDDAEFKIIGVEEGRGKLQGHVGAYVCVTASGTEFRAKAKGEIAALKVAFETPAVWQGKSLTVKYQGLTNKNGVPRFPVGVRLVANEEESTTVTR